MGIVYDIIVTKDDGTPLREFGPIVISRDRAKNPGGQNAEQVLASLYTSMVKGMLAFNYQEGQTKVDALVVIEPPYLRRVTFEDQIPQSASNLGPAVNVGDIVVSLSERV